ncbi:MAG TPA: hypothetical protein VFX22_01715 [Candidatus Kapabacteria bacterium]|nr:hypothetical protein [Candidatus Kapabacteria bacterium]
MITPEMEVAVNWEFSAMLENLQAKGFFGGEDNTLDCLSRIQIETGMRLYALGISEGATLEAKELGKL